MEPKIDLSIMRQDMQKEHGQVTENEWHISDIDDTLNPLLPKINNCGGKIITLEDKVDELENRLLRNNLRLFDLPCHRWALVRAMSNRFAYYTLTQGPERTLLRMCPCRFSCREVLGENAPSLHFCLHLQLSH